MRFDKRWLWAVVVLVVPAGSSGHTSPDKHLIYGRKYIMGTVFEIAAYVDSSQQTSAAIDKAFDEIVRMDNLMSNYKPDSALSHLNRSAHFHAERVPPDLYRVIEEAVQFSKISDGKFDITVAPLVDLWKSAMSGDSMPPLPAQQAQAQACVGYEKIELIPPDQILFHSSCLTLDLGAIGKGYALDRAAQMLHSLRIQDAFLNAGGSTIVAMGSPPGQTGWLLHLRDPSRKMDPQVTLKNQSVSTSEQTAPSLLGHGSAGHIIDPASGQPLETHFAVTVVAPTGTMSDALSTTLLLLGPERGKSVVSRMHQVSAVWVSPMAEVQTAMNGPQISVGGK